MNATSFPVVFFWSKGSLRNQWKQHALLNSKMQKQLATNHFDFHVFFRLSGDLFGNPWPDLYPWPSKHPGIPIPRCFSDRKDSIKMDYKSCMRLNDKHNSGTKWGVSATSLKWIPSCTKKTLHQLHCISLLTTTKKLNVWVFDKYRKFVSVIWRLEPNLVFCNVMCTFTEQCSDIHVWCCFTVSQHVPRSLIILNCWSPVSKMSLLLLYVLCLSTTWS